ncbi:sulfotransferase [Sphaerospermopsis aphanizomenoides BCCUSP55]|uniref:sulfotransferase n=1 Tax=Sphaerospermopsis aphanizomenoides TaxID=459663 RepID=UPI0019031130|nr:sulfotransferase [Sphaerospermopsis aphanizomenoides]MBK1989432.1 sulfotransferase [Sphaerospermopsis aphanizomenoides BCCUSP55]
MQLTTTQVRLMIVDLIEETVQSWDGELDEPISPDTMLIKDLNFASIDFIQLIVAIEEKVEKKLGFHDLLMPNDKYIDDLRVNQLTTFVESRLNSDTVFDQAINLSQPSLAVESKPILNEPIDEIKLVQFRQHIPTPKKWEEEDTLKNKRAVFVLSSPRSGSTLLRIILAGNPQLFAPPELHLLDYNTLAQRKAALDNKLNSHLLEGTIRAIMQIKNCSPEEARKLMEAYEVQGLSTKSFYGILQEWIGNRILVDKTPTYPFHLDFLRRAEMQFSEPLYIHLVRHPYGMIRSFEDAKLDQLVSFMRESSFTRKQLGELLWLVSQQNLLQFLGEIPHHRQLRIRFEDLVNDPESIAQQICNFLNIDFNLEMLDPYKEKEQRMTDGVELVSRFSGDLKFHLHQRIEPNAAFRWQQFHTVDFLGDITWDTAASFGYKK